MRRSRPRRARLARRGAATDRRAPAVADEVNYSPPEPQAAHLHFALVSHRHDRASIVVTSNGSFESWNWILGDAMVYAALIDRLAHHAEIIVLNGKSYRLTKQIGPATPAVRAPALRDSGCAVPIERCALRAPLVMAFRFPLTTAIGCSPPLAIKAPLAPTPLATDGDFTLLQLPRAQ